MTETTAAAKTRKTAAPKAAPAAEPVKPEAAPVTNDLTALLNPQRYEAGTSTVPQEVITFVENAFEAWQKDKNAWQVVTLSSPESVDRIHKQARRYCSERDVRLTFQRRRTDNTNELVYRVRDKIAQKRTKK